MALVAALLGAVKAIRFLERWFRAFSASLLRLVILDARLQFASCNSNVRSKPKYLLFGERGRRVK